VPRYSRSPLVLAHSPARPSVPFTLPRSLLPLTQADWAATDIWLFNPPAPAASGLSPLRVSLQSRSSLSHHAPSPRAAATHGGLSGAGTWMDGRTGDLVCSGAHWTPAFDCTWRKETPRTLLQYYKQFHAVT